jgi:tRNA(Ile)-lysidine synthase
MRERLLPQLAAENPRIVEALGRTAAVCADDYSYILEQLAAIWPILAEELPQQIMFKREVWNGLHPSLQRYTLRRAADRLTGSEELSLAQIEAALAFLAKAQGKRHELGLGLWLELSYNTIVVAPHELLDRLEGRFPQLYGEAAPLPIPGRVDLGGGWLVVAQLTPPEQQDNWWLALEREQLVEPLYVRRRIAGERFRPAGAQGSKRLQDLFVDMKIPRQYRANWPLLTSSSQLLWVAGLRAAEGVVAGSEATHVVWVGLVHKEDKYA